MKARILALTLALQPLLAAHAQEKLDCKTPDGWLGIKLHENTITIMTKIKTETYLYDVEKSDFGDSLYFTSTVFLLKSSLDAPPGESGKLSITTSPQYCGRGSCSPSNSISNGLLELPGEPEVIMDCHGTLKP